MSRLAITEMGIDRMYQPSQFSRPIRTEELIPEINVLYGKNARGKSTLARAIRQLIWSEDLDRFAKVSTSLRLGDHDWRVEIDGEQFLASSDGKVQEWVPFRGGDLSQAYHLSLQSLLDHRRDGFAEEMQRAASGGFDVMAAARDVGLTATRVVKGKPTDRLGRAITAVASRERDYAALDERRRELDRLKREKEEARRRVDRAQAIQLAIDIRTEEELLEELRLNLEPYPEDLDQIVGTEADELKNLETEISRRESDIDVQQEALKAARRQLAESRLSERGLDREDRKRLEELASRLGDSARRTDELEREIAARAEAAEHAWRRVNGAVERDRAYDLDVERLKDASAVARRAIETRDRARALRRELGELEGTLTSEPEQRRDRLQEGVRLLAAWLQTPSVAGSDSGSMLLILVAAILALVAGAILGISVSPIWFSLAVISVLLFLSWSRLRQPPSASDSRNVREEDYRKLDLPAIPSWQVDQVAEQLKKLTEDIAAASLEVQRRQRVENLRRDLEDLQSTERELQSHGREMAQELGFDPTEADEILLLISSLIAWVEAERTRSSSTEELAELRRQRSSWLEVINDVLATYRFDEAESDAAAKAQIDELIDAEHRRSEARKQIESAENRIDSLKREVDERDVKVKSLLDRLGLSEIDIPGARERIARKRKRDGILEEIRTKEESVRQIRNRLERDGATDLLELEEEELRRIQSEVKSDRERAEELADEIAKIEAEVRHAEGETALSDAMKERDEAAEALADERRKDCNRLVGNTLATWVEERSRLEDRPRVLEDAARLLARITHGRYELRIAREGFRVRDTQEGWDQGVEELSGGTRLQLMLAVRVAFLRQLEGDSGTRLPLIVDEALATSDDQRAGTLIDALAEIASERQVFYMTAQLDEVNKFKREAGGEVPINIVNLEAETELEISPSSRPVVPAEIPKPQTDDLAPYATMIDVPKWGGRSKHESLHLWYLVDSVDTLYHLLSRGYRFWGPFESMLQENPEQLSDVDDQEIARMTARARAARTWQLLWSRGRGKALDRQALKASDAVSDTFIDRIAGLCEDLDGDAEKLLDALAAREDERTKGFISSKTEELRQYCLEHGYLVEQTPLTGEEVYRELVRAVSASFAEAGMDVPDVAALLKRLNRE